ncbi:WD repeat domain phosphoinositide-interacting protein 3 [Dirofilaria immitis]|nr:WD repeat domain phosphoinositide-interacting protein 3 [Dirofilaria immitis]
MRRASHVLFNTFNQDFGCFVCGLDDGFRIYNTDPLKQNFNEKLNGGIGAVEMLFRCNYVALVGGGITPAFSTNKVVIWDIINHKEVVQLEMNSDVRAVRLRRDRIVVVLDTSVHIFSFTDQPEKLQVYDSSRNPRGICCLCPASENSLLAFPAPLLRLQFAHKLLDRFYYAMRIQQSSYYSFVLFVCEEEKIPLRKLSFSGEVSVSRFRLPFPSKDKDFYICAFGPQPDSVIVVSSDGSYCKFNFYSKRSECIRQTCSLYLEITSDS